MSTFCVYGVSRETVIAKATKRADAALRNAKPKPADEMQFWRDERERFVDELIKTDKAKQMSAWLDSPQFCRDFIAVALTGARSQCRAMSIMAREQVPDPKKKTGYRTVTRSYNDGSPLPQRA